MSLLGWLAIFILFFIIVGLSCEIVRLTKWLLDIQHNQKMIVQVIDGIIKAITGE